MRPEEFSKISLRIARPFDDSKLWPLRALRVCDTARQVDVLTKNSRVHEERVFPLRYTFPPGPREDLLVYHPVTPV